MKSDPALPPVDTLGHWIARLAIGAIMGAAAFLVTQAIVGDDDQASTAADALVVDVEALVLEPIARTDDPQFAVTLPDVGDDGFAQATLQIDPSDVLSPIVGIQLVPTAPAGAAPLPPVLVERLGLAPLELEPNTPPDDEIDDVILTEAPGLDLDELPLIIAEYADGDGDSGDGDSSDLGFIDLCAEIEDDRCPDPGEPGTVVATFALTVPPPFLVTITVRPSGECAVPVGDADLPVEIVSTTPIDRLELSFWRAAERSSSETTLAISTPMEVANEWLDRFGASESEPPPPIVHCTVFRDLRFDTRHAYVADGTDVFGQSYALRDAGFFPGPGADARPPTLVIPLTDNELLVSAAYRADQSVRIWAFRRNDEPLDAPIDPCVGGAVHPPGYDLRQSPIETVWSSSSGVDLAEAGLDPEYNRRLAGTIRLQEGSFYRLCVFWSVSRLSFDAGVELVEGYDIVTPDALEMNFIVANVTTKDGARLAAGDLEIVVQPAGRARMAPFPHCGSWRNEVDVTGEQRLGDLICSADPRSTALYARGALVRVSATDLDGVRQVTEAVLRVAGCATRCITPEADVYQIGLPTEAGRDFWCGGLGDACDQPGDAWGSVTIVIGYDNLQSSGQRSWSVSDVADLGDQRPEELAETPRLDTNAIPALSGPAVAQTLTVAVSSDRPVTATVTLLNRDGSAVCVTGDHPNSFADDMLSRSRSFEFTGLCPDQQELFPIVELTDENGNASRWHSAPGNPAFGPGEFWGRGYRRTDPIVWTADANLAIDFPTGRFNPRLGAVRINGSDVEWSEPSPFVEFPPGTCRLSSGGASRRAVTSSSGFEVTLEAVMDVVLFEAISAGRCLEPASTTGEPFVQPDPVVLRATLDFAEITLGEEIVLSASVPVSGLSEPLVVTARVTFTDHT